VRDAFGGLHVGQVVLPAILGGSPALPNRQVNAPLRRSNDLPFYGFSRPPILSCTRERRFPVQTLAEACKYARMIDPLSGGGRREKLCGWMDDR